MSEKRFKKGINLSCVDTEAGKSYWYACNLCGLLNKLVEENEQLKQILENLNLNEKNDSVELIDGKFFIRK